MRASLWDKLSITKQQSDLILYFAPKLTMLPLPIQRFDDPFFHFGKAIIQTTRDIVSGYMFDLASYLAMGGTGVVALERTIDYIGTEIPTILHGAFDSVDYLGSTDELALGMDALTIQHLEDIPLFHSKMAFSGIARTEQDIQIVEGGFWNTQDQVMVIVNHDVSIKLRVVGNEVVYANRLDNFADVIRTTLEGLK
jgi:hypothetical protein